MQFYNNSSFSKKYVDDIIKCRKYFLHLRRFPLFSIFDVLLNEVLRNVLLTILAVFVCTEMVLCNLVGSLIVSTNVLIGLINVCGCIYFIGMKLEIVSTMFITIAQGITVDYSAHIVHSFLKTQVDCSSRHERIKEAMINIGPAVFNGATSTFFAFCLCAFGRMPLTGAIFTVFSLIVVSGLFGAFFVLPVLLSWFGPATIANNEVVMIEQNKEGIDNQSFVAEINKDKKKESDQKGIVNKQNNQTPFPCMRLDSQDSENETNHSTTTTRGKLPSSVDFLAADLDISIYNYP